MLGKNLVTERWQTTKYLSSFQQQPNFFHPNYTFVFVFVFHWILVFSRHSCWWEEVVKKITSQEGKFFTLFVDCYCKTILKEMLMCWCWCTESIYKTFLYLLSQSNLENAQCELHICYVYKELKFLKRYIKIIFKGC